MANKKTRPRREVAVPSPFEHARDEMFQHIMRCGVVGADPDHQIEWFNDALQYLGERYHELSKSELAELRTLGERFAQPPKRSQDESVPSADAASAA